MMRKNSCTICFQDWKLTIIFLNSKGIIRYWNCWYNTQITVIHLVLFLIHKQYLVSFTFIYWNTRELLKLSIFFVNEGKKNNQFFVVMISYPF